MKMAEQSRDRKIEFRFKLSNAIITQDEEKVKCVLMQYPHGYIQEEQPLDNHFFLLKAIRHGNQAIIQQLINFGADVHFPAIQPVFSYMNYAALYDKPEIIKFLLEKGVDVNIKSSGGCTALHSASCKGFVQIVNFLLERGADVNARNEMGLTALHGASGRGHKEVIEILLKHGAHLDGKDKQGKTPLIYAFGGGVDEIFRIIVHTDCPSAICTCTSCREKRNEISKFIPVHLVSAYKETIEFLLEKGANAYWEDTSGNTILEYAVRAGHKCITDLMVNHFVKSAGDEMIKGQTLLCNAIGNEDLGQVKLMLNNGANPNLRNANNNFTPLHVAALVGSNEMIKLLLDKGADIDPLVSWKLMDGFESYYTPLQFAVHKNHKSTVDFLLTRGANIDIREIMSALHIATENGCIEMMRLLLKRGIDVDVKTKCGLVSSLHVAAVLKKEDVMEFLLDRGADLSLSPVAIKMAASGGGVCGAAQLLIKEMVKLMSLKIVIPADCIKVITDNIALNDVKLQCEEEIRRMKKEMFPNTIASYFGVFQKGLVELAALAANDNIIEAINSEDFLPKKFPMYASTIVKRVLKGVVRKELMDRLSGFFSNLYKDEDLTEALPELPDKCGRQIFDLLSNDDLKNLISQYRCSKNILTVDEY